MVELVDVLAGDPHPPIGGLDLADQGLDQGRLAASGRADNEGELATADLERDPIEGDLPARVDDRRVLDLDDRRLAFAAALLRGPRRSANVVIGLPAPAGG